MEAVKGFVALSSQTLCKRCNIKLLHGERGEENVHLQRAPRSASGIDFHDLAGQQRRQEREHLRHQRQGLVQLDSVGLQHHHGDLERRRVLLEAQVAIASEENTETILDRQLEALSVLDATAAHLLREPTCLRILVEMHAEAKFAGVF